MAELKFSDLLGLGKGMEKLIDVISKGVGRVTKAHFARKDAEAKVYELKLLREADADQLKLLAQSIKEAQSGTGGIQYKSETIQISSASGLPNYESMNLEQRARQRSLYQELKRQSNIEAITSITAAELEHEAEVKDEPVDEDWINRFFRIVEDVSNEEMQQLWAKVLAGEIKRPKTFSLRTLDLIRNLTEEEARVIMNLGNFAIERGDTTFLLRGNTNDLLRTFDVPHADIALLIELGIIHPDREAVLTLHHSILVAAVDFQLGNHILSVLRQPSAPTMTLPIYSFTKPGREILGLLQINPPFEYVNQLARLLSDKSAAVRYTQLKVENGKRLPAFPFKDFFKVYADFLKGEMNSQL